MSRFPMARVRGVALDATTRKPIAEGAVEIKSGSLSRKVAIDAEGRLEASALLPGTYDFRLQVFGRSSSGTLVTIDDKDLTLELRSQPLQ